jgi:hypothetical protein
LDKSKVDALTISAVEGGVVDCDNLSLLVLASDLQHGTLAARRAKYADLDLFRPVVCRESR